MFFEMWWFGTIVASMHITICASIVNSQHISMNTLYFFAQCKTSIQNEKRETHLQLQTKKMYMMGGLLRLFI